MQYNWAPRTPKWIAGIVTILMLSIFAVPAMADALDQYRVSGDIIERYDGLVEAGPSAPAAAVALVSTVNAKRQELYNNRASQQGVAASEVGKVYAMEIFGSAPAGTRFKQPDGSIIQK